MNRLCATLSKLILAIIAAVCCAFAATPVNAIGALVANTYSARYVANSFYFEDFTADYYLSRDEDGTSRLRVVEQLTAIFPSTDQNHGINRVIPFTNNDGQNLTMPSTDTIYINVERNGKTEPVNKVEVGDGYFNVYIGDSKQYVHGRQIYTLEYEFENLIMAFEEWQELYWDTNGNDWTQRFQKLTARVHLDEDIASSWTGKTACYVGYYGGKGEELCQTTKLADGAEFSASNLSAHENLTFVLEFKPGTFAVPEPHYDYRMIIIATAMFITGVGMVILMILTWKSVQEKRRYYKNFFIKPEYTPPRDYNVAEMSANYIGSGANGNSKVATMLELAVHHKIELIKTEKDGAFGKKKTVWKVRILSADLAPEQVVILKILAGSNAALQKNQEITIEKHTATTTLTKLANKFGTYIEENLKKKGLSEDKKAKATNATKTPNYSSFLGFALVIWFMGWFIALAFITDDVPSYIQVVGGDTLLPIMIVVFVAVMIAGLAVVIKSQSFFTHTQKGLEYSRYLDGLKLYIKMAEADRLNFLQSVKGADTSHSGVVKLYEKLLPYAVIFRMEKTWLAEMSRYYEFDDVATPNWYVGMGVFSAHEFAQAMNSVSATMNSTIAYSTSSGSSSSGSGFSVGGGFSGGGGGGGGGGGW